MIGSLFFLAVPRKFIYEANFKHFYSLTPLTGRDQYITITPEVTPNHWPVAVDYKLFSTGSGKLFFSDTSRHVISAINFDGSGAHHLKCTGSNLL